jgi:fructose-bisphosphate aldolase class I
MATTQGSQQPKCLSLWALQKWGGQAGNKAEAQALLVALAKANSEAQQGQFKGPHPVPGGERILQALRLGGAGK